ncbi:YkgJ family cysteine cluster protein [Phormidesmis priestleyi]
MNRKISAQVMSLFAQIDQQTKEFRQATGLSCPSECGHCCNHPNIDITVLDVLPLAIALFQQGKAEQVLNQLETDSPQQCIFYQPDRVNSQKGRCGIYAWRPSICRLFGYATVRDKRGQPNLAACSEHKATRSLTLTHIQQQLAEGLSAPGFVEFAMRLEAIEPAIGSERFPINQAIRLALHKVGLSAQFSALEDQPL